MFPFPWIQPLNHFIGNAHESRYSKMVVRDWYGQVRQNSEVAVCHISTPLLLILLHPKSTKFQVITNYNIKYL